MSILLVAPGLSNPSTLWMRRQLEMICDEVGCLVTDVDDARNYFPKLKFILLKASRGFISNRIAHYFNLLQLLRAIHSKNITVILIHYATTAVSFKKVLLTTQKPIFIHCHGYDVTWNAKSAGVPMHGDRYVAQILSMPDNVIFIGNSKKTIQRLVDIGIPQKRIVLKYLGVEVPDAYSGSCLKTEKLTVLYLGRLVDFKGPDLVIRAFEVACYKGFEGVLVVAGDGPLRQTCELLRAHSPFKDRITLLGAVDTKKGEKLRGKADIFTAHNCTGPLSGQEEAFGVTIIEAMAAGVSIVNASNGSIPELLENGFDSILVESGDIEGHASALLKLQDNPEYRRKISKNAWKKVHDKFSLVQERQKLRKILFLDEV